MPTAAFAVPIAPGQTEAFREFVRDLNTSRRVDMEQTKDGLGLRAESWHVQSTPQGDLCLVCVEADDPWNALAMFATWHTPFAHWMRERLLELTGLDFGQPPEAPLSECVGEW